MKRLLAAALSLCVLLVGVRAEAVTPPGPAWGGVQVSAVNIVASFGVDNTGVTDAGPREQVAFNALATAGKAAWMPGGTYLYLTMVSLPSFLTIYGTPATINKQQLTGGGNFSAWNSNPTLGTPTTITAINTPGSKIVQSATNYSAGQWLFVQDAAALRGNIYYVVSSAPAGGDFNLTLDRPVNYQFAINDTITPITTLLQGVRVFGNGMVFTGTSLGAVSGYIGFGTAYRCEVHDVVMNGSGGVLTSAPVGLNFDIGSYECLADRVRVDGTGATSMIGISFQSNENSRMVDSDTSNCGKGVVIFDDYGSEIHGHTANDCTTAGIVLGSNEIGTPPGCRDTRIVDGYLSGNAIGIYIENGTSYCGVDGTVIKYSTTSGVQIIDNTSPPLGITLDNLVIAGTGTTASHPAIYVNGTAEVQFGHLTAYKNQGPVLDVVGANARVTGDGFQAVSNGLAGGIAQFAVSGTGAFVALKRGYVDNTTTIAGFPQMFAAAGGTTLSMDDVIAEESGASSSVAVACQAVATTLLQRVRTIGTFAVGLLANGGVAAKIYDLGGNDFTAGGLNIDSSARPNWGQFTLNGTTEVAVNGSFFADTPITFSLATVGTTPGNALPYFDKAQAAGTFYVKSPTVSANDVYNWHAVHNVQSMPPVGALLLLLGKLLKRRAKAANDNADMAEKKAA